MPALLELRRAFLSLSLRIPSLLSSLSRPVRASVPFNSISIQSFPFGFSLPLPSSLRLPFFPAPFFPSRGLALNLHHIISLPAVGSSSQPPSQIAQELPFKCQVSSVPSAPRRRQPVRQTPPATSPKMSPSTRLPTTASPTSDFPPPVTISPSPRGIRKFAFMKSTIKVKVKGRHCSSMRLPSSTAVGLR